VNIEPPKRRFRLLLKIDGDSWKDVLGAIRSREFTLSTDWPDEGPKESWNGAGGGPSAGDTTEVIVDLGMTHERYFEQLHAYLDQEREKKEPGDGPRPGL
jgi:hypothetical protein